ncbi:MAG: cell division protein FtsK [Streptomyces sp.]|nr:cell division protein FtsK [Streptomyces sp.]
MSPVTPPHASTSAELIALGWRLLHDAEIVGAVGFGVLVVLVTASAVLARRKPAAHWAVVGFPLTRFRMRRRWRGVCERRGLSVPGGLGHTDANGQHVPAKALIPRLRRFRRLPGGVPGLTVQASLLPGQEPAAVAVLEEALRNTFRVHSVRVTSPVPGEIELTVMRADPLKVVALPAVLTDAGTPVPVPSGSAVLAARVGNREDGAPWLLNLAEDTGAPHYLIAGATRSGKSTLLNAAVVAFAPWPVALVGIDLKGGLELMPYRARFSALACDLPEAATLIRGLLAEMTARTALCARYGVRSIWHLPDMVRPVPVVVFVDEAAELFSPITKADKPLTDETGPGVYRLVRQGAALGIHLVLSGQRFGSEIGASVTGIRSQLTGRVCHRVNDVETAKMVVGDRPAALDAALAIGESERGYAVILDGSRHLRARAYHVTPDQARTVAERFAHLTPDLPRLTAEGRTDLPAAA